MNHHRLFFIFLFSSIFSLSFAQPSEFLHCEVVKYHTTIVLSDNKLTSTDSVIIQINDRNGEKYSKISIPHNKNRRLSELSVWIETVDGRRIRELKKSEFHVKSAVDAMSLYEDDFVTTCYAKHNEYPYRIGYTYTHTTSQFIYITDWSPVLFPEIITREAVLKTTIPIVAKTTLYIKNANQISKKTAGHSEITTYKASFSTPYREEQFGIPIEDVAPRICIAPLDFMMGVSGTYKDWASIGNWYYNLNKNLLDIPADEILKVKSACQGMQSPREITRKIYHYLQDNTRYINVSIGLGGLKSYPASYVAKNKYGDCKALSIYMKALLNVAGIQSYTAIIQNELQPSDIVFESAISQFNHVLLIVPLDKDTLWIETTNQNIPFGYVHSGIQNRKALLIDEYNSRLISTPAFKATDNSIRRNMKIEINELGVASVNTDFIFRGYFFELFNELKNLYHTNDQDQFIREYMPFTLYEMKDWQMDQADRDTCSISLKTSCVIYKTLKKAGDEYFLESLPVRTGIFEKPSDRKLPLEWPFPYLNIDSTEISIPVGFKIVKVPEDLELKNDFGSYVSSYRNVDGKLLITKKLLIRAQKCTVEQYKSFYEFIENIKKNDKKIVTLKKSN